jgi:alpha-galactosidase/6-phospho-beta-glucosidase family protein
MKLTIIGGAGVRTPLFIEALLRRAPALGLTTVSLMDLQEEKLELIGALCRELVRRAGDPVAVELTNDPRSALNGADFVVTTIRVGNEAGRVLDERIALRHGVLGQETTGPGGFAMALRSIPAILSYADLMAEICPDAWLLNFTNPAGLVAQAIAVARPGMRVAGICDTPSGMLRDVAHALGHREEELEFGFFGLNHLSWIHRARLNGADVLPDLLASDTRLSRLSDFPFEPALVRLIGMIPNEYLYYYYYREQALANIAAAGSTRGEQVQRLSRTLLENLRAADPVRHPERGLSVFHDYIRARRSTYMAAETAGAMERGSESEQAEAGGEGYAGLALAVMNATVAGGRHRLVLNVPNHGAMPTLRDDDVIECICAVDAAGATPLPIGEVPEHALRLMQQVKLYERYTVEAVAHRSRELAIMALMAHPLVGSYSLATALVDGYLEAHGAYVGDWQ